MLIYFLNAKKAKGLRETTLFLPHSARFLEGHIERRCKWHTFSLSHRSAVDVTYRRPCRSIAHFRMAHLPFLFSFALHFAVGKVLTGDHTYTLPYITREQVTLLLVVNDLHQSCI